MAKASKNIVELEGQLEIIHLRLNGFRPHGLIEEIRKSIASQDGLISVRTYYHATIKTDLGIHLHLDQNENNVNVSEFGVRLATALKEYGIVEHSIWIEEKGGVNTNQS